MSLDGLIVVDKPVGPTSADVVARVRHALERWLRARDGGATPGRRGPRVKAGHAGTLDPMATGVLVLCLGEVTKMAQYLLGADKAYRAVVRLGEATDTADAEGQVIARADPARLAALTGAEVEAALEAFRGEIRQTPPMYSALKYRGRSLHELAREGIEVERQPRPVRIDRLDLEQAALAGTPPTVTLRLDCSSGTYVRSLAHDLGVALGVHAHLGELRRLRVGRFAVEAAIPLASLESGAAEGRPLAELGLRPPREALSGLPVLQVSEERARRVRCGQPQLIAELCTEVEPACAGSVEARAAVLALRGGDSVGLEDPAGRPVAVLRLQAPGHQRLFTERAFYVEPTPSAAGGSAD